MKLRLLALGFVFGVTTALLSSQVLSGDKSDKAEKADKGAETKQMMELWKKYALPGDYHQKLEVFAGDWDVTTRIWMEGPGEPPNVSNSTVQSELIFGGRFLRTNMRGMMSLEVEGEMMEFPIEAVGYVGYDNFKQKYVSIWIDSHNTGIYYTEGFVDPTGRIFTYIGTMDEWETGQRDKPYKMVDQVISENRIVSQMHDLTMPEGQTRVFEMVAARKSAP